MFDYTHRDAILGSPTNCPSLEFLEAGGDRVFGAVPNASNIVCVTHNLKSRERIGHVSLWFVTGTVA